MVERSSSAALPRNARIARIARIARTARIARHTPCRAPALSEPGRGLCSASLPRGCFAAALSSEARDWRQRASWPPACRIACLPSCLPAWPPVQSNSCLAWLPAGWLSAVAISRFESSNPRDSLAG